MTLDVDRPFDLFWRNPYNYHQQLVANRETSIAWDRGVLQKTRVNPQKFSHVKFRHLGRWRVYSISSWDAIEYDQDCPPGKPRGVYPTWDASGDPWSTLVRYIENPWGEDNDLIRDPDLDQSERPVRGQPHRVFITNMLRANTLEGKIQIASLSRVQRDFPDVEFFLHRLYGYGDLFGNNFRAGSMDPRVTASHGRVVLSNGKAVDPRVSDRSLVEPMIRHMGWEWEDLEDAGNRCSFNIQTARFASLHWDKNMTPPKVKPKHFRPDIQGSDLDAAASFLKKDCPA